MTREEKLAVDKWLAEAKEANEAFFARVAQGVLRQTAIPVIGEKR
jgi:hypothetical protein